MTGSYRAVEVVVLVAVLARVEHDAPARDEREQAREKEVEEQHLGVLLAGEGCGFEWCFEGKICSRRGRMKTRKKELVNGAAVMDLSALASVHGLQTAACESSLLRVNSPSGQALNSFFHLQASAFT